MANTPVKMRQYFQVVTMYFNNLQYLRNEKELTQREVSEILNCKRSTYDNWEHGNVMIPLDMADKLSCFYKVKLSYIYGIDKELIKVENIKRINYDKMLTTLNEKKEEYKHTYTYIADNIKCNVSTVYRYFKGEFFPPIDRLVALANLYNLELDVLCGKL